MTKTIEINEERSKNQKLAQCYPKIEFFISALEKVKKLRANAKIKKTIFIFIILKLKDY